MRDIVCVAHGRMRGRRAFERAARGLEVLWTRRPGDLPRLARPCDLLIVAGGDGTIQEAANAIIGTDTVLGIVPGGTGNDVARMFGIPNDPAEALRIALEGPTRPMDAVKIELKRSSRIFVNIAEAGYGAEACRYMNRIGRLAGRRFAYPLGIAAALATHRSRPATIRFDNETVDVKRLTGIIVANGRYFARGLQPAPDAQPDDGILDVVLLEDLSRPTIVRKVPKLRYGLPDDPGIRPFRAKRIEIDGHPETGVEADGEFLGNLPICMSVIHHGLLVRAPERG